MVVKRSWPKRFAWISAFLCIVSCAIASILPLLGIVGVAGLSLYFEYTAIGLILLSLAFFGYIALKRSQ